MALKRIYRVTEDTLPSTEAKTEPELEGQISLFDGRIEQFASDEPTTEFECPDCGEKFASPQGLGAHKRWAHKTEVEEAE